MSTEKKRVAVTQSESARPVFKRILVAFDGSSHSVKALDVAKELARFFGAELIILNAVELPIPYVQARVRRADIAEALRVGKSRARTKVDGLVRQAREESINARGEVLDKPSSTSSLILDFAGKEGVDLIVTGTRGLGGFKKLVFGSVATGLVSYAHCSVLVVR